mgnify:CR=1 FL=1
MFRIVELSIENFVDTLVESCYQSSNLLGSRISRLQLVREPRQRATRAEATRMKEENNDDNGSRSWGC